MRGLSGRNAARGGDRLAYVQSQSSKDTKEIGSAIGAFMKANGLKQAGPPNTINKRYDDPEIGGS